ncbi:MAG: glycosyltransferase family 39 protein [Euryarchaeota archaeon]|nr:glycosyltransferase family 39 protein [Euryarchaeota archaeon]
MPGLSSEREHSAARSLLPLIGITTFALAIRLLYIDLSQPEDPDPYRMAKVAEAMLQGKLKLTGDLFGNLWAAVQPLYPFLMAVSSFGTHDLLAGGKIIALIAGVAAVPAVFYLWKGLASREVALLAAWFVAVNPYEWLYSFHAYRDTLFLLLITASFYLFYKAEEDFRLLPWLAFTLGLATLTREESYLLIASLYICLLVTRMIPALLGRKPRLKTEDAKYLVASVILFLVIVAPWFSYRFVETGEIIPSAVKLELKEKGHTGLDWIPAMDMMVSFPLLILSIYGIVISRSKWEKYLPFYLFTIFYSLSHMWYVTVSFEFIARYGLPLLPIFVGWSSIAIDDLIISKRKGIPRYMFVLIVSAIIFLPLFHGMTTISKLENLSPRNLAEVEAAIWFERETESNATILIDGWNENYFDYYTTKRVLSEFDYFDELTFLNRSSSIEIKYPFESFLVSEDIRYITAYDSYALSIYPTS